MKAFLLAAGIGSRLRPLTDTVPKCMLPIGGQPLLEIWLSSLHRAGVDEVLVNLHHLPDVVTSYLERRGEPPAVHAVFEPELLGSAGTLSANREWVQDEELFLVCNADNLTTVDLHALVEAHRRGGRLATLALFRSDEPWRCGIVELDEQDVVVSFVEKPASPKSNLANAGLYVFTPSAIDCITGPPPCDIAYDLLPHLLGDAKGVVVEDYLRDIGTCASYELALTEWLRARDGAVIC